MLYLIVEMKFFLLTAFVIGVAIGWVSCERIVTIGTKDTVEEF